MSDFATLNDVIALWRPLNADESAMVTKLLPLVSASLRVEAKKVNKDLDAMVAADADLKEVAKGVTVDIVKRYINDNTDSPSFSQMTESAGGYSLTGTFLSGGGGLFIKKSELSRLGLRVQRYGVIDFYGTD